MLQQAQNDFYASEEEAAMDYAAAVNEEIKDLFAAGADVVQIDEPYMQARPEKARRTACRRSTARSMASPGRRRCTSASATRRSSTSGRAATRSCPSWRSAAAARSRSRPRSRSSTARCSQALGGKQLMVGCIDLADPEVETAEIIVERIERALPYRRGRERHPRARLRHEVPAARDGRRQARAMVEAAKILRSRHARDGQRLRARCTTSSCDADAARRLRRRLAAAGAPRARGDRHRARLRAHDPRPEGARRARRRPARAARRGRVRAGGDACAGGDGERREDEVRAWTPTARSPSAAARRPGSARRSRSRRGCRSSPSRRPTRAAR